MFYMVIRATDKLPEYKEEFIKFTSEMGALKLGGPFELKSKRSSPHFFNSGDFKDGTSISRLGDYYAEVILEEVGKDNFDLLFGPAYKGIPLAVAVSEALARKGVNKGFVFNRKEEKTHGEVSGAKNKKDLQKKLLVGSEIKDGSRVLIVEDVFTSGDTKYEAVNIINSVANDVEIPAVVIAVDRQEIGEDGSSAIREFREKTGVNTFSIINASDIRDYMLINNSAETAMAMDKYFRAWGVPEVQKRYDVWNDQKIIPLQKSVIPACDVEELDKFEEIVEATADLPGIGGFKIGFELGLGYSAGEVVKAARKYTKKPIIYDHQKAGTDIPDTGRNFARVMKKSGVDAVILFPQAGPVTQTAWQGFALEAGLKVLVGGEMTHKGYKVSEGGYISDEALERMYLNGAARGISDFVVPGNRVDRIAHYKQMLEEKGVRPVFYSPGFIAQGGSIGEAAKAAGECFGHAIVGRAIYAAKDIRKAAEEITAPIVTK